MPIKDLFKKAQYITVPDFKKQFTEKHSEKIQCPGCMREISKNDYEKAFCVCHLCGHHGKLTAWERIALITDENSFLETNSNIISANPLQFEGYREKLEKLKKSTGLNEAVVTGKAKINNIDCMIGVMDSRFMAASMGSAVGEKLTLLFEEAHGLRLPVIVFTTSGGARMHEGILSLMQMAKVSAAVGLHGEAGLLYIAVLSDPTLGGVSASFAMLGDVIFAEPGALVGFAGKRVIEGTTGVKLPDDYQSSEFLMKHGFVDAVVNRKEMKDKLTKVISLSDAAANTCVKMTGSGGGGNE